MSLSPSPPVSSALQEYDVTHMIIIFFLAAIFAWLFSNAASTKQLPLRSLLLPSRLSAQLDYFDVLKGDHASLLSLYQKEVHTLKDFLSKEANDLHAKGHEHIISHLEALGMGSLPSEEKYRHLRMFSYFNSMSSIYLPFLSQLMDIDELGDRRGYCITLVDQMLEGLNRDHNFSATIYFINAKGVRNKLHTSFYFKMPFRHVNPRAWVRLVTNLMEKYPMDSVHKLGQLSCTHNNRTVHRKGTVDVKSRNYIFERSQITQRIMVSLMKLQYIATLLFPGVVPASRQNIQISVISELSALAAHNFAIHQNGNQKMTPKAIFLEGVKIMKEHNVPSDIWSVCEYTNRSTPFRPAYNPKMSPLALSTICQNAEVFLEYFPNMAEMLKKYCNYERPLKDVAKKESDDESEEIPQRSVKNNSSRKRKNYKRSNVNSSKMVVKEIKYDSESDDVDVLTEQLGSLSVIDKPENWTHTQAWYTAATIHLAQYCRVKVLYPHFFPDGNVPDKFAWDDLVEDDSSDEIKFCVKVVNKRNSIVKYDEIFKFLPDLDSAYASLSKRFNLDKSALDFVLTFAPGPRINETPKAKSNLIDESSARFTLMILGLNRACDRIREAEIDLTEVSSLCQAVEKFRNPHAHPHELVKAQIEALKNELKQWIQ